jgi:hypothetical protein
VTDAPPQRAGITPSTGVKLALFGLVLIAASAAALHDAGRYDHLGAEGTRVDAEVLSTRTVMAGSASNRSRELRATLRFTSADGRSITGETEIDSETFEALEQGRTRRVPVVYMKGDPEGFRVASVNTGDTSGARTAGWVIRIAGALAVVSGIVLAIIAHGRRRGRTG